jgi:hypothetical protein
MAVANHGKTVRHLNTNHISGAVAQLGERVVRNDEVGSSILLGSTTSINMPR